MRRALLVVLLVDKLWPRPPDAILLSYHMGKYMCEVAAAVLIDFIERCRSRGMISTSEAAYRRSRPVDA